MLSLLVALLALVASSPDLATRFEWQRGTSATEPWRLVTAQFTHWSPEHLAWDLTIFVVFGSLLELRARGLFARVLGLTALALGVMLPILYPSMSSYRGLSGIDCALAAAWAVVQLRASSSWDRAVGTATLLFVCGKVGLEYATAEALFVDAARGGFVSLPAAHALGAAMGVAVAVVGAAGTGGRPRARDTGGALGLKLDGALRR